MGALKTSRMTSVLARWLSQLLLVAVLLRALIPVGYMPDLPAAANGLFKVVICTTDGAKTLAVDANGDLAPTEHPADEGDHRDHPCAFSGIVSIADRTEISQVSLPAIYRVAHFSLRESGILPPVRAGPAVGSRAPPIVS